MGQGAGLGQAAPCGPARVVTQYAVTSAPNREYSDPQHWRLLGSNDDEKSWVLLDVQTNQSFKARCQRRVFAISNRTAYTTYRFQVEGQDSVQIGELELLGPVVGVASEGALYASVSSSKDYPLLGPAEQAFDNDPATRWVSLNTGEKVCWLQCRYTRDPEVLVTNISQCLILAQRSANRNPLAERAPQILSNLTAQANRPLRALSGYALTSANDFPCRDPRDWRLQGSNDGGKRWNTLDARRNETFSTRLQKRVFMLTNPAACALYRLQIDSVRVPAGVPGGATCVQLAEIEPLYAGREGNGKFSVVVAAQGENAPMEGALAAFDGNASTKWLDFAEAGGTNKSSWIQWQYLAGEETPVISRRWLSAVRTRPPQPIGLRLEGVVVAWIAESGTLGFLDESGFQFFKLRSSHIQGQPGDRVRLAGRLELEPGALVVQEPELTRLGSLPVAAELEPGQPFAPQQSFLLGSVEGRVESVSVGRVHLDFKLVGTNGEMVVKVPDAQLQEISLFAGCRVRVRGIVEPVLERDGRRVAGTIWLADLDDLALAARSQGDWDLWPKYALESLWRTNCPAAPGSPVRVTGKFIEFAAQDRLVIASGSGTNQVIIHTREKPALRADGCVEAIGFLGREGHEPVLRPAQWRLAGANLGRQESLPEQDNVAGPVTGIRQIYERLAKNPGQGFPVRIHGVITFIDLGLSSFYLQDGPDAILVEGQYQAGLAPRLHQEGLYIELEGEVDPNQAMVNATSSVKVLGKGRLPTPRQCSWEALMSGKEDRQWVQVEGVVSACQCHRLTLVVTGGRLVVWFNDLDRESEGRLLGSVVRVNGVCDAVRNDRDRRLGLRLMAPCGECVEMVRAAPRDPFSLPLLPLRRVMESDSPEAGQPIRLLKTAGVVTYAGPRLLFIQQGDEGLRIYPRAGVQAGPGDQVEVVGFAEPDGFSPKLVQALVRKVGTASLPAANPIDVLQAELSVQDATRGQIEGTVVGASARESVQVLELQDATQQRRFSAIIPAATNLLSRLAVGSRVRLAGVFKAETDMLPDFGQALTSFQMYVNSGADIQVLAQPPWWTARHTLLGLGALGFILLLALAWVSLLRNQVRLQTAQLQSEITEHKRAEIALENSERFMRSLVESLPQNVSRKDLNGRVTFVNQFFCRTLGKPMDQILGKTDWDLFPEALAAKYRRDDEQVLKSGQLFETVEENRNAEGKKTYVQVIKTPLYDAENRPIGLQVVFWDVTARKEAEERLEIAQKGLVETSRQAGMAEVATGVLHNVGNVLNSVNVSAAIVTDNLKRSKVSGLAKTVALLRKHEADLGGFLTADPRGKQVVSYLDELAEHLATEQAASAKELRELTANIEHIKDIVAMQQNYAKFVGVTEVVPVKDLVEDALRLNAGALTRHDIQLTRQYHPGPLRISVEKHKVIQILTNLVRNAKYACDDSGRADKQMGVRVENGDGRVRISVVDNGVGIPAANLTRIFSHGFTTRRDGHGFGLHSGALAAREMGGTLTAHSDGPGQGATFTLELPLFQ
jgi:PAS domain S-box-containing protein